MAKKKAKKMIRRKKTQIQSKVFMYILAGIVAVLVIFYTFKAIQAFKGEKRRAIMVELEEKLKTAVEIASSKFGSLSVEAFNLPEGTEEVCFVDLENIPAVLETSLVDRFPIIKNSLEGNENVNTFVIINGKVGESLYIGPVCFDWPYYKCIKTPKNILKAAFEGMGGCTQIKTGLIILNITNKKNMEMYANVSVVMIGDNEGWRNLLKVTPIAMWNANPGGTAAITTYPFLIYHKSANTTVITGDFQLDNLFEKYGAGDIRHFGALPVELQGLDRNVSEQNFGSDYLSYWDEINDIIVVDYDNEEGALISSLFASYLIAPILFVNEANFGEAEMNLISNRNVYVIDNLNQSIEEYIIDYSATSIKYNSTYIREDEAINPYQRMFSSVLPMIKIS
jgi:hypothetical protein